MALQFDYRNCDESLTDEHYARWTEYVVFHAMFVGMGHITRINYVQFAYRVFMFNSAQGNVSYTMPQLLDIVRPYIGLTTNASPMSDAAFYKKLREISEETMRVFRVTDAPKTEYVSESGGA